jgi:hypothetical protein
MSDDPGTYSFSDRPPPKRKFVPRPRRRFDPDDGDEPAGDRSDPWWAFDWFWPALLVAGILWVGLGLPAMKWHWVGLGLVAAGLAVIAFGQFYLYMTIREQDGWETAMLAYLFSWHRLLYLHQNIELTLKPNVLSLVGVLMAVTGIGLFLIGLRPKP